MLLTSLMVTAVMSVAITTRGSGKKNVNKLTAEAGARRLADGSQELCDRRPEPAYLGHSGPRSRNY